MIIIIEGRASMANIRQFAAVPNMNQGDLALSAVLYLHVYYILQILKYNQKLQLCFQEAR